jgi:ribosome-binding factor A
MSAAHAKLQHEIRQIVGTVLPEAPLECGIIALTEVTITTDAQFATIWISALVQPQIAMDYMQKRLPFIQAKVRKLPYKSSPLLRIHYDERSARGERIDALLVE